MPKTKPKAPAGRAQSDRVEDLLVPPRWMPLWRVLLAVARSHDPFLKGASKTESTWFRWLFSQRPTCCNHDAQNGQKLTLVFVLEELGRGACGTDEVDSTPEVVTIEALTLRRGIAQARALGLCKGHAHSVKAWGGLRPACEQLVAKEFLPRKPLHPLGWSVS